MKMHHTEEQAVQALFADGQARGMDIDICCYTGATIASALAAVASPRDAFGTVRILIRHPGAGYRIPMDGGRAALTRQTIVASIQQYLRVLGPISRKIEIRGYACEPSLRAVLVGRRKGFFTPYTIGPAADAGPTRLDYVPAGNPVLASAAGGSISEAMLRTATERFANLWALACPLVPLPALLFDLDGTLLDSLPAQCDAWREALRAFGLADTDPRMAMVEPVVAQGIVTEDVLERLQVRNVDGEALIAHRERAYRARLAAGGATLYPDVVGTVRELHRRGYRLAVVSGAGAEIVSQVLESAGIAECFATIVSREQVATPKPAPDSLRHACQALGIAPQAAVAIGDTLADQTAAQCAPMPFILVVRKHILGRLSWHAAARPFEAIFSLADLLDLFPSLAA